MKRIGFFKKVGVLALSLSFLVYFHAKAQDYTTTTVVEHPVKDFKAGYLGARYQMTFSDFQLNKPEGGSISTSFVASHGWGGELGLNMSRHAALQLEVMYDQLAEDFMQDNNVTERVHLAYINVPLLLVLNTNSMAPVNLNICAGPQVGFNTSSSITTVSGQNTDQVNAVLSAKKNDVGVAYGAGLDFLLGEALKLSVGYRGVQGLVDISDNSANLTTHDYYILHRSHTITNAGYAALAIVF